MSIRGYGQVRTKMVPQAPKATKEVKLQISKLEVENKAAQLMAQKNELPEGTVAVAEGRGDDGCYKSGDIFAGRQPTIKRAPLCDPQDEGEKEGVTYNWERIRRVKVKGGGWKIEYKVVKGYDQAKLKHKTQFYKSGTLPRVQE